MLDIVAEPRRIANRIVEESMIAANICAARVLRDKLGFGVYNVHTGFDPANTEQLAALLKTHDVHVDPTEVLTRKGSASCAGNWTLSRPAAAFAASSRLRKSAPSRARTLVLGLKPMPPDLADPYGAT